MTGMTNQQTGSKDNNTDSPLVIASPHLAEEAARHRLLQPPLLRDEVEEVLAAGRPLQDQDVRVGPLVKV